MSCCSTFYRPLRGYDVVLNWSELWHERNCENDSFIPSLTLVLQSGQCHYKNQEHHFPSIEFKMVRKKESTPQWRIVSKFASFFVIQNIDCTARKIEVEGEELKIVLNLWPGLFIIIRCTIEKCHSNTQDMHILEWIMVPQSQGTFKIV